VITFLDRLPIYAPQSSERRSVVLETCGYNSIILQRVGESQVGEAFPRVCLDTTADPALEDWIAVGSDISVGVNTRSLHPGSADARPERGVARRACQQPCSSLLIRPAVATVIPDAVP